MQSETTKTCRENYPMFKVLYPSSLYRHCCKCVINLSSNSCIDVIKLSVCHYLKAMPKEVTHNKELSTQLSNFTFPLHSKPKCEQCLTLLNAPDEQFTYSIWCPRVDHSTLAVDGVVPKFIPLDCANGACTSCGPSKIDIDRCPIINNHTRIIDCDEWHEAPCPGLSSSCMKKTKNSGGSRKLQV